MLHPGSIVQICCQCGKRTFKQVCPRCRHRICPACGGFHEAPPPKEKNH